MGNEGKKICIVGHGPSTEGRGLGSIIDSYDIVIRMVECGFQNEKDYGKKYNIGIFTAGISLLWSKTSERIPSDMYWRITRSLQYEQDTFDWKRGRLVRILRKTIREWVGKKYYCSRGMSAIIGSIELLEPEEIALVGFDTVLRGVFSMNHHPQALNDFIRRNTTRKRNVHDWNLEKAMVSHFIKNGINIKIL